MAMDAVPFDLLRSSLDSLKLQFQAVWDSGIDNRAILIQRNKYAADLRLDESDIDWLFIQAGGYTSGFPQSHYRLPPDTDGLVIPRGTSSGASWRSDKPVPSFGFRRWHQVIGLSAVEVAANAAGRLLDDLPENIRQELWDALPEDKSFLSCGEWTRWSEAVFELAWKRKGKGVVGSPLKADRHTPVRFDKPDDRPLPDYEDWYSMRDWYSKLDNFAAASVQAIAILQSWLDELPKQTTEADEQECVWPQLPTLAEPQQTGVLAAMVAFPEIVANGSYAGGGIGPWSYALPTSEKGRYGTLGIMADHLCTEGHTPTAAAWAVYWLAKHRLIVETGETVADGESWCVTTPALLEWWRKGCPTESLGAFQSADKRDGQSDTPKKSQKKSKRRQLNGHGTACIKEFRAYKRRGDSQTMRYVVKEYVAEHPEVSEATLYRSLTDNSDQWKPTAG